jgi:serralysin
MKNLALFLALLILLYAGYTYGGNLPFLNNNTIYAAGDLTVIWGVPVGQPIFTVINSKPGDTQSKTVQVNNGASTARPVAIRGNITSETKNLSNALFITISQNGTDLYGGPSGQKTVAQFMTESTDPNGIELSTISANASASYVITLTFDPLAGNDFQAAIVTFDLTIGIAFDVPDSCSAMTFNGPTIFGTQGDDRLNGTNKSEIIIGFEGNDGIDGGNANDCIIAGAGNDQVSGGNGNDVLIGQENNDVIDGGNGNDQVSGNEGNDTLDGGNNDDTLTGGTGNDILKGGNGSDTLDGGLGTTDSADGQNGRDTCIAETEMRCEL